MKKTFIRTAVTAAAAGALALSTAGPAAAATVSEPLATGLVGPLSLAVGHDGTVYVAQSFAGVLTAIDPDGTQRTVLTAQPGYEVSGLDASRRSGLFYTTGTGNEAGFTGGQLRRFLSDGRDILNADMEKYEAEANPDGDVHYGFTGLAPTCTDIPEMIAGGATGYPGIVESHPYAVAVLSSNARVVADAAGNDLVRVNANRTISTIAVLPPQPLEITEVAFEILNSILAEQGSPTLPECVIGSTYLFEAVPTDVEVGPHGQLYVTTLPGGLEDPRLGAQGSVYKVGPRTGKVTRIGTGFAGATGVAVSPSGDVYVAELFGGRISKLVDGGPQTVAEVPMPAAVEWADGKLYATVDVFANGSVVTITP